MTWEMAAVAGVDPLPMTFAELRRAYQVKVDLAWSPIAMLCALTANANRNPRTRPYKTSDFYRPQIAPKKKAFDMDGLKAIFTKPA